MLRSGRNSFYCAPSGVESRIGSGIQVPIFVRISFFFYFFILSLWFAIFTCLMCAVFFFFFFLIYAAYIYTVREYIESGWSDSPGNVAPLFGYMRAEKRFEFYMSKFHNRETPFSTYDGTFVPVGGGVLYLMVYGAFVVTMAAVPRLEPWVIYGVATRLWKSCLRQALDGDSDGKSVFARGVRDFEDIPGSARDAILSLCAYAEFGRPDEYRLPPNGGFDSVHYPDAVRYGPVSHTSDGERIHHKWVCGHKNVAFWKTLLCNNELSKEEILREAWTGSGGLYCYVRPDKCVQPLDSTAAVFIIITTRFPIGEALLIPPFMTFSTVGLNDTLHNPNRPPGLDNLPLDILLVITAHLHPLFIPSLLTVNRALRSTLLPIIDQITYKSIRRYTPHILPARPFPVASRVRDADTGAATICRGYAYKGRVTVPAMEVSPVEHTFDETKKGQEEEECWVREWAEKGGIDLVCGFDYDPEQRGSVGNAAGDTKGWRENVEGVGGIPWMGYAIASKRSASMMNRRRIWAIALQFEQLAIEMGIL